MTLRTRRGSLFVEYIAFWKKIPGVLPRGTTPSETEARPHLCKQGFLFTLKKKPDVSYAWGRPPLTLDPVLVVGLPISPVIGSWIAAPKQDRECPTGLRRHGGRTPAHS